MAHPKLSHRLRHESTDLSPSSVSISLSYVRVRPRRARVARRGEVCMEAQSRPKGIQSTVIVPRTRWVGRLRLWPCVLIQIRIKFTHRSHR